MGEGALLGMRDSGRGADREIGVPFKLVLIFVDYNEYVGCYPDKKEYTQVASYR